MKSCQCSHRPRPVWPLCPTFERRTLGQSPVSARGLPLSHPPLYCLDDAGPAHNGARGGRAGNSGQTDNFPNFPPSLYLLWPLSRACPRGRHSQGLAPLFGCWSYEKQRAWPAMHVKLLLAVLHFVATFVARRHSKIYGPPARPALMVCVRARNLGRKFQYFDVQFGLRSHHKFDGKTYVVDGRLSG